MFKEVVARQPWCYNRRVIDKADTSTPVAVDQCAVNCLDEAWGFVRIMHTMYYS